MAFRQQSSEVNRGCSRGLTQAFCRSVYKAYIALYAVVNNHEEIQPISKLFWHWYIPSHYLWGKPKWIMSSTVKDIIRPVVSVALMCYNSIVSVVWRRIHPFHCLLARVVREPDHPVSEVESQEHSTPSLAAAAPLGLVVRQGRRSSQHARGKWTGSCVGLVATQSLWPVLRRITYSYY